jgi:UDP-N-acetyl-D-mannosaminuronate dehydrogenase
VIAESNLLVFLTDHRQFLDLSPRTLNEKVVVDTRGIWR